NQSDSESLQLNPIAEELRAGLAGLGVQLVFGRYYDDPAIFYPEDGRMRFLADYENGRNGYLLLLFSAQAEGKRYGHTLEELARWPHIAWMQLRTDRFQQDAAVNSRYGIATYPATKAGLLAAFTRFLTESASRQETGSGVRQVPLLRGDTDINMLLEIRLGDALPWAQACSILQPTPPGLADCLRRKFFAYLVPERIERLMDLPGTGMGKGGISFSRAVRDALKQGFFTRFKKERREAILRRILTELEKVRDRELGDQAGVEGSLAYLAWQKHYQLVNLQVAPDLALKKLAELEGTPLVFSLTADLEEVNPVPLRKRVEGNKDSLQRLARLFGKRSGLSLVKRYPLSRKQWGGAVVLVLLLLTASGLGVQQWLRTEQGEVRLSVLAEQGGGTGWVGVEESGNTLQKRSSTEGLLRLPVETHLSLRKKWQLVFYDQDLQPAYTLNFGLINENTLVRLRYEEIESQGKTIGQYIDHGDGTITDTKTGLIWKRCSEGLEGVNCEEGEVKRYNWDDAVKRFKDVKYAGYSDWRLPTIDELKTLVYCSKGVQDKESGWCNKGSEALTINQQVFPGTALWYWSGSPYASDLDYACYVLFYGGNSSAGYRSFDSMRFGVCAADSDFVFCPNGAVYNQPRVTPRGTMYLVRFLGVLPRAEYI
ncbi:MAG: DUF1566 domain-containing protein, partial [Candidatus Electrothrix sp. AUS1_2]|nr:DUF1566 domain-containing protein [Candidatus Electrothrix sp. AUS1_2]